MTQLVISSLRNWSAPVAETDTAASVSIGRRPLTATPVAGRWPTSGLSGRRHEVSAEIEPWWRRRSTGALS